MGMLGSTITGYGCPGISSVGYGLIAREGIGDAIGMIRRDASFHLALKRLPRQRVRRACER